MDLSVRLIAFQVLLLVCLIKPAASLSCYQQAYTPGQTSYYSSNNNLPKMTCQGSATSCFKMVCFGTSAYYTVRGCYDYTNPLYNCQTLATQCPGAVGQCFTCNGNNCNGAWSSGSSMKTVLILLGLPAFFYYALMKN